VPLGLEWLSLLFIAGGHVLFFQVVKRNSFAASVIQVEASQPVIRSGPYGRVRHPMYLGFAMMTVFTPLALGSFIALPVSMLILPIVAWRILNEEKMLRGALPGYVEYCRHTRCRLIPYVW
jgi:protein-S-isoprenylcysteine O-methyltransferase Ste14